MQGGGTELGQLVLAFQDLPHLLDSSTRPLADGTPLEREPSPDHRDHRAHHR
jgi:hypothetical protein